ncbi:MAG: hypothetical protein RR423_00085 [Hydrogenoanaerobacterium sp.]
MISMNTEEEIIGLLKEKKALFTEYKKCTDEMVQASVDTIEDYITKREQLANKIDKITFRITECCDGAKNAAELHRALQPSVCGGASGEDTKAVFAASQEVFALIKQISAQEPAIIKRMQQQRDELLVKIKKSHNIPKIAKYLSGIASHPQNGTVLGEKYDKV